MKRLTPRQKRAKARRDAANAHARLALGAAPANTDDPDRQWIMEEHDSLPERVRLHQKEHYE